MKSNLFLSTQNPVKKVELLSYQADPQIPSEQFYKTMKSAQRRLFHRGIISAIAGNIIYFINGHKKHEQSFDINGYTFTLNPSKTTLLASKDQGILQQLVDCALKLKIKSLQ